MKNILYVLGAIFIILGLLGFFNNPILGTFQVDALHNVIHLATGVLAIIFAGMGDSQARTFCLVFGIIYLLVTILGFISGTGKILGLISNNMADNFLHLVIAIVFLALGMRKPTGMAASSGM